jgi:hypothetical protein
MTGFFSLNSYEINHFQIEEGRIFWRKSFESALTKEELLTRLERTGNCKDLLATESGIIGTLNKVALDYEGYGSSMGTTPIYLVVNDLYASVYVKFEESQYTTTVEKIKIIPVKDDINSKYSSDLEEYAIEKIKTAFRSAFLKKPSAIIDYTLTNIFEF